MEIFFIDLHETGGGHILIINQFHAVPELLIELLGESCNEGVILRSENFSLSLGYDLDLVGLGLLTVEGTDALKDRITVLGLYDLAGLFSSKVKSCCLKCTVFFPFAKRDRTLISFVVLGHEFLKACAV